MKAILTGASGFLGKALNQELILRSDLTVEVLSRVNLDLAPQEPSTTKLKDSTTFLKAPDFENCEILIHLGSFTPKQHYEANLIRENFESLEFTLKLIKKKFKKLKKVIYASTMDVYERSNSQISEISPISVKNAYVASKLFAEVALSNFCKEEKINIDIFRIGHVYGPGQEIYDKVLERIIQAFTNKNINLNLDPNQSLNLLHVDDLVRIVIESIIDFNSGSGILNLVSNKNIRIQDIIRICEDYYQEELKFQWVKADNTFAYNFANSKVNAKYGSDRIEFADGLRQLLALRNL